METFTEKVFSIVKKIPKGMVSTYGEIAKQLGNKYLARAVGNALHKNTDPNSIPCHRVVNSKGKLAKNYKFGGREGQRKRLKEEGIVL